MAGWTRDAIATRVEALAREHHGSAFVNAVERFSREILDERERRVLHQVLMERSPQRRTIGWFVRDLVSRFELRRQPR